MVPTRHADCIAALWGSGGESATLDTELLMRARKLLIGVASGMLLAGAAQAQVQGPGIYGFAIGAYLFDAGKKDYQFQPTEARMGTKDGPAGRLQVGYRFDIPVDVAVAAQGADFRQNRPVMAAFNERLSARYLALDLEAGYTINLGGAAIRPAVGARYVDFRHTYSESGDRLGMKFKAVGPRVALSASGRLGSSAFSLFGDVSGSALFGRLREQGGGDSIAQHSASKGRMAWNMDAQAGVAWEPYPMVTVAAGVRFEGWWGVNDTRASVPTGIDGRGDRLGFGPFIRLAYNWGAPPADTTAPPLPTGSKSFIVFFDFDRATLTATAMQTIKQAAAQAKTGKATRIDVTGHADRAGS
ncbi:MAG: outer membrane beta-barrel protein, partial [Alphaproteobacteria bacterium]|nr:outer membrane beta-barrel protein [Alphaproteobacteria bacterium]